METRLKKLQLKPSEKWVADTHELLQDRIDVTYENEGRNPSHVTPNFIFLIMKKYKLATYSVATLAVLSVGGFTLATAADASAPGDVLFGLDQAFESLERTVTFSEEAKLELEQEILAEREEEIEELELEDDSEDLLEEAKELVQEQQERIRTQLEEGDEVEAERVREEAQIQLDEELKEMEQLKEQYDEGGNTEAAKGVEEDIESKKQTFEAIYENPKDEQGQGGESEQESEGESERENESEGSGGSTN